MKRSCLKIALLFFIGFASRSLAAYVPLDAGVINVKAAPYYAKGDGVTDDTAAIQQAISDYVCNDPQNLGNYWNRHIIIYLPAGTYLISSPLKWWSGGIWGCYVSFMGESRDSTIIKLKDNCAGYQDPANPSAMLYTASMGSAAEYNGSGADWPGKGEGLEAFDANLWNFTVDAGNGNPGAIGIDYIANNVGFVRNVSIRSSDGQGSIGLSMLRRWNGPLLISDVSVSGFNFGIGVKWGYSPTLEHISLTGQHVAGISNEDQNVTIRDLTSSNTVPAVISCSDSDLPRYSLLVLLDSNLSGGASNQPAVQILGVGNYLLRNISAAGYKAALQDNGTWIPGSNITELASTVLSLFPTPARTLGLPERDTPVYEDDNPSDWANVTNYGAVAGQPGTQDAAPAFQAAIDSGKPVVYVPFGSYVLGSTVKIRGNVRKIVGFGVELHPLASSSFSAGIPLFRVESNAVDTVFIQNFIFYKNPWAANTPLFANPLIEHASTATLVMKDLGISSTSVQVAFSNQPSSGPIFIEDVDCNCMVFNNANVWCRQLDPEQDSGNANWLHVLNTGSKLWILGFKTESEGTLVQTINNGSTELLGGFQFLWSGSSTPAFINTESSVSLSYITVNYNDYANHVVETRDGTTLTLTRANVVNRWNGSAVPLYVGYRARPRIERFVMGAGTNTAALWWSDTTNKVYIDLSPVLTPTAQWQVVTGPLNSVTNWVFNIRTNRTQDYYRIRGK
jgi:hypothetical protein